MNDDRIRDLRNYRADSFQLVPADIAGAIVWGIMLAVFAFGILPDVCHSLCKFFH